MQSKADSLNRLYTDHAICGRTMPIPDFQTMMLPFLEIIRDGRLYTMQEVINQLAIRYHLTPEERYQRSPNSANVVFNNKIGWTKTHLKNAQLIENPQRGIVKISEKGLRSSSSLSDTVTYNRMDSFLEENSVFSYVLPGQGKINYTRGFSFI